MQHRSSLTSVLLWTFGFMGGIVLVNLLIALFTDTISRVKASSEVEIRGGSNHTPKPLRPSPTRPRPEPPALTTPRHPL